MLENLDFNLDGINSYEKGVVNVHINNGLRNENFLPLANVRTENVRGRSEPYLMDISYEPITIPLTIYFDQGFDKHKLREIALWLKGDSLNYRPFYFIEDTERLFFVTYSGEPRFNHNGVSGYIDITFLTSSPYAFSKELKHMSFNVEEEKIISLSNYGDLKVKPEVEIEKIGEGDIHITNLSNDNLSFSLEEIKDEEIIYIDNYNEDIVSSLEDEGVYRYDSMKGRFLELILGENNIEVKGECKITFRYRKLLIQG